MIAFNTCRFCGEYARHDTVIRYGKRHYAHPRCFLDAGKSIDRLSVVEVEKFPYRLVIDRGLEGRVMEIINKGRRLSTSSEGCAA